MLLLVFYVCIGSCTYLVVPLAENDKASIH
jgi:hypothetical protein